MDTAALGRLVDASRALKDLEWRLTTGPTGLGRARLGGALALDELTLWAGSGPFGPFGFSRYGSDGVVTLKSHWLPSCTK